MNENDIYKALECCQGTYNRNCEKCPYKKYKMHCISTVSCSSLLKKDLLELLNSYRELKIQFEILDAECSRLEKEEQNHEAEIQAYQSFLYKIHNELYPSQLQVECIRVAIERFLERIENKHDGT